jgi:hypothetical protein
MMEFLAEWMGKPTTVVGLVAFLVLAALIGGLQFEIGCLILRGRLSRGLKELRKAGNSAAFAADFGGVCVGVAEAFRGDRHLRGEWEGCVSGLQLAHGGVTASRRAEELFQASKILSRASIMHYRHLPGMLVGMGLVFTFLGISVVIDQAAAALVDAGDAAALHRLLSAAALKFWTSLAGVALSLICSLHYRARVRPVINLLASFNRQLSAMAPVADSQRIVEAVALLRADLGKISDETLEKLLKKTTELLKEAVGRSMEKFGEPVNRLAASMDALAERFDQIAARVEKACEQLSTSTATLATVVGDAGKALREDFASAAKSAAAAKDSFGAIEADASKAEKSIGAMSTVIKKLEAIINGLASIEPLPESLNQAGSGLREAATQLAEAWERHARRVEAADLQMGKSLDTLPGVFDDYSSALGKYTSDLDAHLEKTLNILTEWVAYIAELQGAAGNGGRRPSRAESGMPVEPIE